MRVCVLGDSHVAALKLGLVQVQPQFPEITFTFFAAGADHMNDITVENECLVPTTDYVRQMWEATSGGITQIEPGFDHYVLCALGIRITKATAAYMNLFAQNNRSPPAEDTLAAAFQDLAEETLGARTFRKLREISDRPAILIGNPYPAEDRTPKLSARVQRTGQARQIAAFYNRGCARFAECWGGQFSEQPDETIDDTMLLTKAEYSAAPPHLLGHTVGDDRGHMNAQFGAVVMSAIIRMLSEN